MPKAIWKNIVLAESNKTLIVEGNHYFPPDSVNRQFFLESDTQHHLSLERFGFLLSYQGWTG